MILTKHERYALKQAMTLVDIDKKKFALSVLLGCMGLGSAIALGATSAWLIARASQHPPVLELSIAVVLVRAFGIGKALFRYLERLASHSVALSGMASLRTNVYDKLSHHSAASLASLRRGDLLARTGTDVDSVGDLIVKSVLPACVALILGLATSIAMIIINPPSGIILFLCLILAGVVGPLLTMRAARTAELAQQKAALELSATSMVVMDGATELSVSGQIRSVKKHLSGVEDDIQRAEDQAALPQAFASIIDTTAMLLAVLGALYFGAQAVEAGTVSAVFYAVLVLTPLASFEATAQLAPAAVQLVTSAGAASRIVDLLADSHPDTDNPVTLSDHARSNPTIIAKDLAIGWPDGPVVAEGINLEIHPGTHTAIVGPSGIGKTTLLATLVGMLEPKSGSVTVDGINMHDLSRADASSIVTMTAEDAHIFETSVYENIRVARGDVTRDEALDYLHKTGLGEWIDQLPDGLDTQIGSGATTVSGGERRRLLLARALAAPAPLALLDEPGEHIDTAQADRLVRDILDTGRGHTGIMLVTHRLSALDAADTIHVMSKADKDSPAHITDSGTHQELIDRNEVYRWSLERENQ